MRTLAPNTLLYSEMVTTGALLHGDVGRHLAHDPADSPVALQLGGDDPDALARCATLAEAWGYDEVNLNVGCPSSRVQRGRFGACLMAHPEVVRDAVVAMRDACSLEVTVKHRIGIDDLDQYEHMRRFVDVVATSGCRRFTVHARKAWLQGLSPKENRNIPPLRYDEVYRLKRERPDLDIEINGGVTSVDAVQAHLGHVDAVMIGRAAVDNPYMMAEVDAALFGGTPLSRRAAALAMVPYLEELAEAGQPAHRLTRHMLQLFAGQRGARAFKRTLSEGGRALGPGVLLDALAKVDAMRGAA